MNREFFFLRLFVNYPYINIHTHHHPDENDVISLLNITEDPALTPTNKWVSIGIHPWQKNNAEIENIKKFARNTHVIAIGECGLDKLIDIDLKVQEEIFVQQLKIAVKEKKPVIIHCVKAFNELIRIKKENKITVPLLVHGFNNNDQIGKELIKNGFYLSFGKALLTKGSNASKIIKELPTDRIFLETDDADISIKRIFECAALILSINEDELRKMIYKNFKKVFTNE